MKHSSMKSGSPIAPQILVFSLVMAAFANVYITQPVLPVLQREFGADATKTSLTVSALIFGIALANLPFGMLSDRYAIKPIIMIGGLVVSFCSILAAAASNLELLIAVRFIQGLFVPALTTCLAAHLARSLPLDKLNVAMGSYVSATVAGGLGGRLLGGWIHPPLHWRYAFLAAAALLLLATFAAARWLPPAGEAAREEKPAGFLELIKRKELLRMYLVAFGAFFVFSSLFNYLPFYLSRPPFYVRTEIITVLYLAYLLGVVIGPAAGHLANRLGGGATLALGTALLGLSTIITLVKSLIVIAAGLLGICAGFFTIHAAAVGTVNRDLTSSRGRVNSLYVLFYYLGGSVGITLNGRVFTIAGWPGVVLVACAVLVMLFGAALAEMTRERELKRG